MLIGSKEIKPLNKPFTTSENVHCATLIIKFIKKLLKTQYNNPLFKPLTTNVLRLYEHRGNK